MTLLPAVREASIVIDMEFKTLRERLGEINFEMVRADSDAYFEAVLTSDEYDNTALKLKETLGEPIYYGSGRLSSEVRKKISAFGGITKGQVLYYRWERIKDIFAMFWPWRDGQHITLKAGVV